MLLLTLGRRRCRDEQADFDRQRASYRRRRIYRLSRAPRRRSRSCVAMHIGVVSAAAGRWIKKPRDRTKIGVAVIVRWSCRVRG